MIQCLGCLNCSRTKIIPLNVRIWFSNKIIFLHLFLEKTCYASLAVSDWPLTSRPILCVYNLLFIFESGLPVPFESPLSQHVNVAMGTDIVWDKQSYCALSQPSVDSLVPAGGATSLGSLVRWRNRSTRFGFMKCRQTGRLKSVDVPTARKAVDKRVKGCVVWRHFIHISQTRRAT